MELLTVRVSKDSPGGFWLRFTVFIDFDDSRSRPVGRATTMVAAGQTLLAPGPTESQERVAMRTKRRYSLRATGAGFHSQRSHDMNK